MIAPFQRLFRLIGGLAVAAVAATLTPAQAAVPALKLEFLQPTGQVAPTDSISVFVHLTNIDANQSFNFNATTGVDGMSATDLPTTAWTWNPDTSSYEDVAFASYSGFSLVTAYGCSSTFSQPDCTSGPYSFTFDGNLGTSFQLGAGQSHDYRFGVFNPTAGAAPEGTYTLYSAQLWLLVEGTAADGRSLNGVVVLGNTCSAAPVDCTDIGQTFSRTVVAAAVPEPSETLLLSLGLVALLGLARRRAARTAS